MLHEWLRRLSLALYAPDTGANGGSGDDGGEGNGGDSESGGGEESSSSTETPSYPEFHKQYPEHLRGHESLKSKDGGWLAPGDILEGFIEYSGKRERLVELPGEDATPEQRDAFARSVGRPDSPGDYDLSKPEDWPNTVPWSNNGAKAFAESVFKAGIPKAQAEAMFRDNMGQVKSAFLGNQTSIARQQAEWDADLEGSYKDGTEAAVLKADRAATMLGDPTVPAILKEKGIARHPGIVKLLNKTWDAIGEDKIFSGAVDAQDPTAGSNKKRIQSRYSNTQFPREKG